MKDRLKTLLMAVLPFPLTAKGITDMMTAGTTVLGFCTAVASFATAILILLWWVRKWRRDK